MIKPALLALANGEVFAGRSIGCEGDAIGEVVFNTSMAGYQEILTDPSYAKQIVTLCYPHIGNVGCNSQDQESLKVWAQGLVVRDAALAHSNWRSEQSLTEYLQQNRVVAISDIDTRHLTHILRDEGAQAGCITTDVTNPKAAIAKAREFPGMNGMDLAIEVTAPAIYDWQKSSGVWSLEKTQHKQSQPFHVVAYDYGVKHHILRILVDKGCKVTVLPANTPAETALNAHPDGIFLSNGPGDPAACDYAITAIRQFMETNIPIFGICLGFQLLGLACGAKSLKMKFGHHGANHPVVNTANHHVLITSQNHGFAIDEATLPEFLEVTHRSLFDNSLQGIRHRHKPIFGFQGHPEASPGPHDGYAMFDEFIKLMEQQQR